MPMHAFSYIGTSARTNHTVYGDINAQHRVPNVLLDVRVSVLQ